MLLAEPGCHVTLKLYNSESGVVTFPPLPFSTPPEIRFLTRSTGLAKGNEEAGLEVRWKLGAHTVNNIIQC